MKNIIEKYKNKAVELFGERVKNGHCGFCGKELKEGEYCECSKAAKINRFYKKINHKTSGLVSDYGLFENISIIQRRYCPKLPKKFEGMSFEDYKTSEYSQKKALEIVREYHKNAIENFLTGMNMILFGNYGTGKTMLMSILCKALVDNYLLKCQYINAVDLINEIKDTFNRVDKSITFKTILDRYKKADILFLDDIDKCKSTEFLNEIFYAITNYRTENELPTIISANHTPEELDSQFFGEAIVSRLVNVNEAKLVNFSHKNYRLEGV